MPTDEQRRYLDRAGVIVRALEDSEARRRDLGLAAIHWRQRRSLDYDDFSKVKGSITSYDRQAFSGDDKASWDTLEAANTLVSWSQKPIDGAARARLPIFVAKKNASDADYGLMRAFIDDLAAAGFRNIVRNVEDAAILIELSDIRRRDADSGDQTRKHAGYDEEMFNVTFGFGMRLAWIGARGLPPEKITDEETDTTKEATAAAVAKTAAAAVASFDRFMRQPPP
jgi:hypothetical protein